MALITCSECGKQVSDRASACPNCGAPVSVESTPKEIKCAECGAVLPSGAETCPSCGCPVKVQPAEIVQTAQSTPPQQTAQPIPPQQTAQSTPPQQTAQPMPPQQTAQPIPPQQTAQSTPPPQQTAQPAPPQQTVYTAPSVNPVRVQLGTVKARVRDIINRKTQIANAWLFIFSAASIVMFLIAFVKYMKVIGMAEDIVSNNIIKATLASWFFEVIEDILKSVRAAKWCLIIALISVAALLIIDLIRMSGKKVMRAWALTLPMCVFGLVSPFICGVSNFPTDNEFIREAGDLVDTLELISNTKFGAYIGICVFLIIVFFFISLVAASSVPTVKSFCQNCGNNVIGVLVGDVCPQCKERRYVFGFSPVEHDIAKAYPYSGEMLVGQSPVRIGQMIFVIAVNIFFIVVMLCVGSSGIAVMAFIVALVVIVSAVFLINRGIRDEIKVTPSDVSVRSKDGKALIPISQIIEVLTNDSGDLAVCVRGRTFIFTDVSNRAQIAAALRTLLSKR